MTLTTLFCPVCGREQQIDLVEYLDHISRPGHPYTCGNDSCPSHTEMVPTDENIAAYKAAMDRMIREGLEIRYGRTQSEN